MENTNNVFFMKKFIDAPITENIDILILSASIDKRCYAITNHLLASGVSISKIVVLDYQKARPSTKMESFDDYYQLNSLSNVEYINCIKEDSDTQYICKLSLPSQAKIVVDITCIDTPDLFRIFYVIKEFLRPESIDVLYAEPKYYNYFNGIYFDYDNEIVEREYRPLPEYFTSAVSREIVLVCFLGFEKLISKYIHEKKEHSDVIVINGFPSYYPKLKDISLEHNYALISTIGVERVRYTQANNPFAAYNTLLEISTNNSTNKLLDICVLGSKPMALGACIFALKNPENVSVSYPFPNRYQIHTSSEVSDTWRYTIHL